MVYNPKRDDELETDMDSTSPLDTETPSGPPALNPMVAKYLQEKSSALKDAQSRSNDNQLLAGLARAGGTLSHALTRSTAPMDESGYNSLDKAATAPQDQVMAEQAFQAKDVANQTASFNLAKDSAQNDADSDESIAFRKVLMSTAPFLKSAYGDDFDKITAADKSNLLDMVKMRETIEARKQENIIKAKTAAYEHDAKRTAAAVKDKELSSTQAKQRGLYETGALAEQQYRNAIKDKDEYDPAGVGQVIDNSDWAPNFMRNNKAIEARAAQSNWIEAYLRDASGAAIPPSERMAYAKDFFAQPGDPAEVVQNKQKLRETKMENARVGAGGDKTTSKADMNGGSGGFPRTLRRNGKTVTVGSQSEYDEASSEGWK